MTPLQAIDTRIAALEAGLSELRGIRALFVDQPVLPPVVLPTVTHDEPRTRRSPGKAAAPSQRGKQNERAILQALADGPLMFGDLQRRSGVPKGSLNAVTHRMKNLVENTQAGWALTQHGRETLLEQSGAANGAAAPQ